MAATAASQNYSGKLSVMAIGARGLTRANIRGSADPFLRISAGTMPKRFTQSEPAKETLAPEWFHRLNVNFDADSTVRVEVLSKDITSAGVQMGYVDIPIHSFVGAPVDKWYKLQRPNNPYDVAAREFGEVHVSLSYIERKIASTVSIKPVASKDIIKLRGHLAKAGTIKELLELEDGSNVVLIEFADIDSADRAMGLGAILPGTTHPIEITHATVTIDVAAAEKEARLRVLAERAAREEAARLAAELAAKSEAERKAAEERAAKEREVKQWMEYIRLINLKQREFDNRREQLTRKHFEAQALENQRKEVVEQTDLLRASRYNGSIVKEGLFYYIIENSRMRLIGSPQVISDWGLDPSKEIPKPPGVNLIVGHPKPEKSQLLASEFKIMEEGQRKYATELKELQDAIRERNHREEQLWAPYENKLFQRENDPGVVYWVRNHEGCPMDLVKLRSWGFTPDSIGLCTVLDVLPIGAEVQDRAIEEAQGPPKAWSPAQQPPPSNGNDCDLNGLLIVEPGTNVYYYVFEGTKHAVETVELCTTYGWQIAHATQVPHDRIRHMPEGMHLTPDGSFIHQETDKLPSKFAALREQRELHERLARELVYLQEKIRHHDRGYFEGRIVEYPQTQQLFLMAGGMKNPGDSKTFFKIGYNLEQTVELPDPHRLPTWTTGPEITADRAASRGALQYAMAATSEKLLQDESRMESVINERLAAYDDAQGLYDSIKTWVDYKMPGDPPTKPGLLPPGVVAAPPAPAPAPAPVPKAAPAPAAPARPNIVIQSAEYYFNPTFGGKKSVDVRNQIQLHANNHGSVNISDFNSLNGDPAPGKVKELTVTYTIDGKPGKVTLKEGNTLRLP